MFSETKSHSPFVDVPHDLILHGELHELPLFVLQNPPHRCTHAQVKAFVHIPNYQYTKGHVRTDEKLTIPRLQVLTFRKYPERSDSSPRPPSPATRRASAQPNPAAEVGGAAEEAEKWRRRLVRSWRRAGELQRAAALMVAMADIAGRSSHACSVPERICSSLCFFK